VVTRNGIPVDELRSSHRRSVPRELLLEAFGTAPRIDTARFREDLDAVVDQRPVPRA